MPVYMPFAGSGMNRPAGGLPAVYVTVWNVALENTTESPALITSFDGKNASSVVPLGVPAGGRACSPAATCHVAAWPTPAPMSANTHTPSTISFRITLSSISLAGALDASNCDENLPCAREAVQWVGKMILSHP